MHPLVIAGLAGAGASLAGGLINNAWSDARTNKQWQRTLYMQDRQNAYNAPVAQMERLAEAGLNPNLVYGNGGSTIQSAGGNAPNPPNTQPIDTQGVLQMVNTIVNAMLRKDEIQAQKDMQETSITAQKDMQQVSVQSQEGMQSKDIQSRESMQKNQIIADRTSQIEKLAQEDEHFRKLLKQRISEFNDTHNLNTVLVRSQAYKNYTDADVAKERVMIERAQYRMIARLNSLQLDMGRDALRAQKISNFLSNPYNFTIERVEEFFVDELGMSDFSRYDAEELVNIKNNLIRGWRYNSEVSGDWLFSRWNAFAGPVKDALSVGMMISK